MKPKKSQTKKFTFDLFTSKKPLASKAPVSFKFPFNMSTSLNTNMLWNISSNSALSKIDYAE